MLLRYFKKSECGAIGFPFSLFPSPDRLGADVQGCPKYRLGEAHLFTNLLDALRDILRRRFDLGLCGSVSRNSGGFPFATFDLHGLSCGLDELLPERALLLCLRHDSASNVLANFLRSFSSARVRSSFTPFAYTRSR